jgi:preprotein translocase subunit SecE
MAVNTTAVPRNPFRRVALFWKEMMEELRKATWPTMEELRTSTLVVMVAVMFLGLFLCVTDFAVFNLVTFVTHMVAPAK